jgi:hypothetical protein
MTIDEIKHETANRELSNTQSPWVIYGHLVLTLLGGKLALDINGGPFFHPSKVVAFLSSTPGQLVGATFFTLVSFSVISGVGVLLWSFQCDDKQTAGKIRHKAILGLVGTPAVVAVYSYLLGVTPTIALTFVGLH